MSKCHNVRNPMLIFSLSSLMVVLDIQYSADGLDIPINRTAFTVETPLLSVYQSRIIADTRCKLWKS